MVEHARLPFSKADIWLACAASPRESEGKTLEPTEFENKLKDTQRLLNESRQMLKGKTSAIRGFVSDADTIRKKAGGRSALAPTRPEGEYQ